MPLVAACQQCMVLTEHVPVPTGCDPACGEARLAQSRHLTLQQEVAAAVRKMHWMVPTTTGLVPGEAMMAAAEEELVLSARVMQAYSLGSTHCHMKVGAAHALPAQENHAQHYNSECSLPQQALAQGGGSISALVQNCFEYRRRRQQHRHPSHQEESC